ncbi:hypothetical protein LY90DRAFT_55363 [Neocallimastix californiae]|uniref:Uncharacterized protein n=1 Tax=Neocallimastix californiae TaxID=1754190 RepID=A0A1Y2BRV0_9FUNG|nr:hypothetical protein LY90DRAFT_55363 [Neocallimastix californiae]|eukprot:ORY37357.1 hypothetical protein LY90DRAFT_55363 [Neocallimastix californiae]
MLQPEAIINGRKQGASPKQGQYSKKTWSDLCRYYMLKQFLQTIQQFQQFQNKQELQKLDPSNNSTNTSTSTTTIITLSEKNQNQDQNQDQVQDLSGRTYEDIKKAMAPRYREARNYLFYGHPYEHDDDDDGDDDDDENNNNNNNDANNNSSKNNNDSGNGNDSNGNNDYRRTKDSISIPHPVSESLSKRGILKGWTRKPKGEQSFKI